MKQIKKYKDIKIDENKHNKDSKGNQKLPKNYKYFCECCITFVVTIVVMNLTYLTTNLYFTNPINIGLNKDGTLHTCPL